MVTDRLLDVLPRTAGPGRRRPADRRRLRARRRRRRVRHAGVRGRRAGAARRPRASTSRRSSARHPGTDVHFASKALPCAPVTRILAEEGLGCDVASAGELAIALAAGFDPAHILLHGNAKSDRDIGDALAAGVGVIVIDGPDDVDRLERLAPTRQRVLLRVNPAVPGATHAAMDTGSPEAKFGVALDDAPALLDRIAARRRARAARPARAHRLAAARPRRLRPRRRGDRRARRASPSTTSAAGSGSRYRPEDARAVGRRLRRGDRRRAAHAPRPGRAADRRARPLGRRPLDRHALLGRDGQARRAHPRRGRRRHGRQPRADALRPALRAVRARRRPRGRRRASSSATTARAATCSSAASSSRPRRSATSSWCPSPAPTATRCPEQLQRRAPAAGGHLPRRRRPARRAARDDGRPAGAGRAR